MLRNDLETYTTLWKNFGRVLKEGAGFDFDNKDRLMKLYLFESSADPEKLTTLSDYLGRMKPDQKAIYFLAGTFTACGGEFTASGGIPGEGLRGIVSRRSR